MPTSIGGNIFKPLVTVRVPGKEPHLSPKPNILGTKTMFASLGGAPKGQKSAVQGLHENEARLG